MKYAWEKKARKLCADSISEFFAAFGKDGRFQIVSVAVVNHETGEAALIEVGKPIGGVTGADFAKDIYGDAHDHYITAVEAM